MRLDASGSRLLQSCTHLHQRAGQKSSHAITQYRRYSGLPQPKIGESSRSHDAVSQSGHSFGQLFDKIKHTDVNLINKEPDLAAFDELNPSKGKSSSKGFFQDTKASNPEAWKLTFRRVIRSFTFKQLGTLCKQADIPMRVFRKYRVKQIYKASKDTRAKMLMVHRFRMIDPLQQSDRNLERAKPSPDSTLEMPISQIALLLLALGGQKEIQRLLQAQKVKLLPIKVKKDDNLLLILQGSEGGVASVQLWLSSFMERIQSNTQSLSSYSISDSLHPPDDHRLRLISQMSQTVVSLDNSAKNVTIHSVNENALATAETMLSQYLHDAQLTQQRKYFSYASSPDLSKGGRMVTEESEFAFVPHVGPSPLPWQSEPGTLGGLFRIAQQTEISPGENVFTKHQQQESSKAALTHLDVKNDTIKSRIDDSELFNNLKSSIDENKTSSGIWSYSADFGHLLFDNLNHSNTSRVLSLVKPPLSGAWPLKIGLDWLEKLEKRQVDLSHTPSFCSDIPPLAFSLDAGFISPVGFGATSRMMADDKYGNANVTRNNEKWSEELLRLGFPLGLGRTKNELTNIVDLSTTTFTESVVITYAGKEGDLIFRVRESEKGDAEGDTSSSYTFVAGEISKVAIADVIVPEASVDLRLSATHADPISQEDLLKDEGLQRYFTGGAGEIMNRNATEKDSKIEGMRPKGEAVEGSQESAAESAAVDVERARQQTVLPRRVTIKDQDFIFISAKKTDRWEWSLDTEPAVYHQGKIIMERAATGEKDSYMSSFKIHFSERQEVEDFEAEGWKENHQVAFQTTEVEGVDSSSLQESQEIKEIEEAQVDEEERRKEQEESEVQSATTLTKLPKWDTMRSYVDLFLARGYRSVRGR